MTPDAAPLDFPRYVEVMAHLRQFPVDKGTEVVSRMGVQKRAWEASAAKWSAARDAELACGKTDLSDQFASVFTRTRKRLERARPSLESLGPLLVEEAEPAPAPPPPVALPPPVIAMISAQLAPPAPAAPSFLVHQAEAPAAVSAPWVPEVPRPVLFEAPRPLVSALLSTLPLGASSPLPELPFSTAPSSPERALQGAFAHAQAVQGPAAPRRPSENLGGTVGVSSEVISPVLPFPTRTPAAPGPRELTLPQYASLRVELHTYPERAAATLTRYGIPVSQRAAVEDRWRARFEADPMSRLEFARAYAAYTAYLRANPA